MKEDTEEKEGLKRRKNIIVFGMPEAERTDTWTHEDINKFVKICNNICQVNIKDSNVTRATRLGKATNDNKRPILIELQEIEMKRELFKNNIQFIIIAHDMTKKHKEELKTLIQKAQQKEKEDQSETVMY